MIGLELFYMDDIKHYIANTINNHPSVIIGPSNEYKKDYDFMFVKQTGNYIPYSLGDIRNIIFSIINNGWDEFTFYCPNEYTDCVKDVETITYDSKYLTYINNYANPFNSFIDLTTSHADSGEVNIKFNKLYSNDEIIKINDEINRIIKENIKDNMSDYDKIKTIHDYLINNTKYDVERNEKGESPWPSHTAYGTLFDHMAICSGYTDTMALFLDKFGIKNYKISSKRHIWNAVYIDNAWKHLDLTWDDPVSNYGDILDYKYFLITTEELKNLDGNLTDHEFDKLFYLEFNN